MANYSELIHAGRRPEALRNIHRQHAEDAHPCRVLVREGKALTPEGAALVRRKNANPPPTPYPSASRLKFRDLEGFR